MATVAGHGRRHKTGSGRARQADVGLRSWLVLALALLSCVWLVAAQGQTPTFRGSAVLVTVDAYPQQNGQIVEGLKPEDFDVFEDGKPQKVENFQFVRVEPAITEASRSDPNSGDEGNRLAADPKNRVFVVFLDHGHISFFGSHETRQPLIDTLRRVLAPSDLFGVMTSKMRPSDLVLGRSLQSIEDQLIRYWPWGERGALIPAPDEEPLLDHFKLNRCGAVRMFDDGAVRRRLVDVLIDRRREDAALSSLEGLVAHLGELREARTAVLLFTAGWRLFEPDQKLAEEAWDKAVCPGEYVPAPPPIPGIGIRRGPNTQLVIGDKDQNDEAAWSSELMRLAALDDARRFRDVIVAAQRHNVTFYPIDPEGLEVFDGSMTQRVVSNPRAGSNETVLGQDQNRLRDRIQVLKTLAENTDGLAVVDTNDLSAGLRKVVSDTSAYYLLGYYSTNTKLDGNYHRIQVRMKRPGLTVKARRGYFAPNEPANAAQAGASPAAPAAAALVAEALSTLTRLRSNAELHIYGAVRPTELAVVAEIPGSQVEGGRWAQGGDVQATVTGPNGEQVGTASGRIAPAARGALLVVPLGANAAGPWRVDVKVSAGADRLEDRASVDTGKPAALLGTPIIYRAAPGPRAPIQPVADFQFRRTERVHVEWPMLKPLDQRQARLLGQKGQPLAVGATVTEVPRREESDSSSAGAAASGRGVPFATTNAGGVLAVDVNLAPLSPADYVLEVIAGSGPERERRLLAIRIVQ